MRWLLLGLLGCAGIETPEDTTPDRPDCGGNAPVVGEITAEDNGPTEFGDQTWPGLKFTLPTTDADGDLDVYTIEAFYDGNVDGSVATTGDPIVLEGSLSEEACAVEEANLRMILAVNGDPPANTWLEFGLIVYDADGNASNGGEPIPVEVTTPSR